MLMIAGSFQFIFLFVGVFLDLCIFRPSGVSLVEDAKEYFLGKETLKNYLYGLLFLCFGGILVNIWQFLWQDRPLPVIFDISQSPALIKWSLLLIVCDFVFYIDHFVSHKLNALWSGHKFHHTAQRFTSVFVTFRLSPELGFYLFPAFIPMFFGYSIVETVLMANIVMSYGFMLHSERIPKLPGFIENIFMTPSLHRVHHGTQDQYLDKNFAFIFSFWDTIFGTRAEEIETPALGALHYRERSSVLGQYFCGYLDLWEELKEYPRLLDKIKLVFSMPGTQKKKNLLKPRS